MRRGPSASGWKGLGGGVAVGGACSDKEVGVTGKVESCVLADKQALIDLQ